MNPQDLTRFAEGLPPYEDVGGDEELVGYISGVKDALRIVQGLPPEHDPREVWKESRP